LLCLFLSLSLAPLSPSFSLLFSLLSLSLTHLLIRSHSLFISFPPALSPSLPPSLPPSLLSLLVLVCLFPLALSPRSLFLSPSYSLSLTLAPSLSLPSPPLVQRMQEDQRFVAYDAEAAVSACEAGSPSTTSSTSSLSTC
jgi:hypothetical protein